MSSLSCFNPESPLPAIECLPSVGRVTAAMRTARCRAEGCRRSELAAKTRHCRSPEGRLDHGDHQRAYRARRRVRDQTRSFCPPATTTCWTQSGSFSEYGKRVELALSYG